MRNLLATFGILLVCGVATLAAWIFGGRQLSLFIDRFGTVGIASVPIRSIVYEGSGTGGWFTVNDIHLSLKDASPNISLSMGSTKDNQFALASGGKVFAFGPPTSPAENTSDRIATAPPPGDEAFLVTRRSVLSWPTPFDFNFISGESPSSKRHIYYQIRWKKSSGAKLEMLWRYEQSFYPRNGWESGFMVHEGSTGLIRVDIQS